MRPRVFVLSMLAVMVLFTAGASSQVAVIVQPGTIVGSVELIANDVPPDTNLEIFTVPAGVRFKITDMIIANNDLTLNTCCARIHTGPAAALGIARTGNIVIPAGGSVDHSFLNGINFNAGQIVVVRNTAGGAGDLHFTIRGYLFTIP